MSDDQFGQIMRWFEKMNSNFEGRFQRLEETVTGLATEVHEIRELLAHQQDDDRVQRQAIANTRNARVSALETHG